MADATTAARARIDRALAELERKILTLKARPASAPAIADDDLFAPKAGNGGGDGADAARVAELEAAGRAASQALARAAEAVREVLAQADADEDDDDEEETEGEAR